MVRQLRKARGVRAEQVAIPVEPALREVIVRLLSAEPGARGTAAQAAETLEAAAGGGALPERSTPPGRARASKRWLALAAVGACAVLLWHSQPVRPPPGPMTGKTLRASGSRASDADTAAVGDTAPTAPRASTAPAREKKPLAQEPLPEPRSEQIRPDKKGRCPGRKQVPINGGCWGEVLPMSAEECMKNGYMPFKGKCYAPAFEFPKKPQPTSAPSEAREPHLLDE
jgi:hypothetical protein